jgi:hypothetical protein
MWRTRGSIEFVSTYPQRAQTKHIAPQAIKTLEATARERERVERQANEVAVPCVCLARTDGDMAFSQEEVGGGD